jgi:hypothetical protein
MEHIANAALPSLIAKAAPRADRAAAAVNALLAIALSVTVVVLVAFVGSAVAVIVVIFFVVEAVAVDVVVRPVFFAVTVDVSVAGIGDAVAVRVRASRAGSARQFVEIADAVAVAVLRPQQQEHNGRVHRLRVFVHAGPTSDKGQGHAFRSPQFCATGAKRLANTRFDDRVVTT